jgi:hypothetical protein
MLKRSVAIVAMLAPVSMVGCGEGPVVPGPASEGAHPPVNASVLPGPAAAGSPACVPFWSKGSAGSLQIAGGPPPAPLFVTVSAEGRATHLGHYSSSATFVVTFTSPTTAVFDGDGAFTAANGDQLDFEYSGDFFPGPVPGGAGSYEIVGGTGRFAGATGSGIVDSGGNETTFEGELCFAA